MDSPPSSELLIIAATDDGYELTTSPAETFVTNDGRFRGAELATEAGRPTRKGPRKQFNLTQQLVEQQLLPPLELGQTVVERSNGSQYLEYRLPEADQASLFLRARRPVSSQLEQPIEAIRAVSGTCLFSRDAMAATADGSRVPLVDQRYYLDQPICELRLPETLSTYEVENVVRTTAVLNLIAEQQTAPVSADIHLPRIEYYLYQLPAYARGYLSPELMAEWMDTVDQRAAQLAALYAWTADTAIALDEVVPLQPLESYLRQIVADGRPPELAEMQAVLAAGSEVVSRLLEQSYLGSQVTPEACQALNQLSYVAPLLEAGRGPGQFGLQVDHPAEEKIYEAAKAVPPQIFDGQPYRFTSIFAMPKVLCAEQADTFLLGSTPDQVDPDLLERIFELYRYADGDGDASV